MAVSRRSGDERDHNILVRGNMTEAGTFEKLLPGYITQAARNFDLTHEISLLTTTCPAAPPSKEL